MQPAVPPGVTLHSGIAVAPVANHAVREVLIGVPDWPMIAVAVVIPSAAVGVAVFAEKALSTERLINVVDLGAKELRGGPGCSC